jgi:hypothetical protein
LNLHERIYEPKEKSTYKISNMTISNIEFQFDNLEFDRCYEGWWWLVGGWWEDGVVWVWWVEV